MHSRIRVSDLDSWEYFRVGSQELAKKTGKDPLPFDKYVQRLMKDEPPSWQADFGTNYHAALQQDAVNGSGVAHKAKEAFKDFTAEDIELLTPQATEVECRREYRFGDDTVMLVGHTDAICGRTCVDYKFSGKAPDFDSYVDAWQWRAYLTLNPRVERFRYELFHVSKDFKKLLSHDSFDVARYDGMEAEVEKQARDYWFFLRSIEKAGHINLGPRGVVPAQDTYQAVQVTEALCDDAAHVAPEWLAEGAAVDDDRNPRVAWIPVSTGTMAGHWMVRVLPVDIGNGWQTATIGDWIVRYPGTRNFALFDRRTFADEFIPLRNGGYTRC